MRGLWAGLGWIVRTRSFGLRSWAYLWRFAWLRLRRPDIRTRGFLFLGRRATVYCRRGLGHLEIGAEVWVGDGTKIRCHEGWMRIGDRVVFGSNDVVNGYLDVEIEDEVLFADQVYVGDFDHRFDEPGPILAQGIVKTPVRIGAGTWIGVKASVMRGTTIGRGCVVGAHAVARGTYPDGAVAVGVPARIVAHRPG